MTQAHTLYLEILKLLRKKFGNKEKWSEQLDVIMKFLFESKAKKTIGYDEYKPKRCESGCYTVINTSPSTKGGVHWVGVYQKDKQIFVYDSFGRHTNHILKKFYDNMTTKGYDVIDVTHIGDQGQYQQDCGLRAIAWLFLVRIGGLHYALEIHNDH